MHSKVPVTRRCPYRRPLGYRGHLHENRNFPPTALAALDTALHDLAARRLGVLVYRLLGLARPTPTSAYTLTIADREITVEEAKKLSEYPILKVKVGSWKDIETVRAVASKSEAELWVDANEAFSPDEAPEVGRELKNISVAMIEQPVPASAGPEALRRVMEAARLVPLLADESSITAADCQDLRNA